MMRGVAHVIGMKPMLRFFFSSGALSCAIVWREAKGKRVEIAAAAVGAPTAWRNRRRWLSLGKSALSAAASRFSLSLTACCSCVACRPHAHFQPGAMRYLRRVARDKPQACQPSQLLLPCLQGTLTAEATESAPFGCLPHHDGIRA